MRRTDGQKLGEIVVWSEMGVEDAERWARRVVPHLPLKCLLKDKSLIRPGDTAIDDVSLTSEGVSYRPTQSFMVAPKL